MTETLNDVLRPHVAAIKAAAAAGDETAAQIISLHRMYVACPNDRAAPVLCKAVFDEWMQERRG